MKSAKLFLLAATFGIILISGCTKDEVITDINGMFKNPVNSPNVASTSTSLAFQVNAKAYNDALEYPIISVNQSLDAAINIGGLTTGDLTIQVYSADKTMLYKRDFNQNMNFAQKLSFDGDAAKIKLIFNNLTASFNCSFAVK